MGRLYFEEIRRKFPKEFIQRGKDIANFRPPGGENFRQLSERVLNKFQYIMENTDGNILITGHAGVNRVIICHILGVPIDNIFSISQDYGCLNLIGWSKGKYRLKTLNKLTKIIPA
ncbi:hypothetical protein N752_28995 [Desulforamulus aquiferis]|nr:histidine phosphatase family protein [Desulforamulus aquiferis]RYD01616.1 hypothetical protein N752_28995 [Desulforamulus aquiferis]